MTTSDELWALKRRSVEMARSLKGGRVFVDPLPRPQEAPRQKARPNHAPGGPAWPTSAQWNKVFGLLTYVDDDGVFQEPTRSTVEAFVRFANGYAVGPLTRVQFIEAINLTLHDVNGWGRSDELVELASDPLAVLTKGRPHWARLKRPKKVR